MKPVLRKKFISFGICLTAIMALMIPCVFATYQNNNIGFSFRIQGSVDNAQETKKRFRDTTDPSNSWKVQMVTSGEGKGTITNFWLETTNGRSASSEFSIKQGDVARYMKANKRGNHTNVLLTAENNNFFSTKTYNVSGYWDEETGIYLK